MNSDFNKFHKTVNNSKFLNIKKWASFPLNKIIDNKSKIYNISGIYVIENIDIEILYVGKAKSIYGRIYSHYKATLGNEKASAWKQFFEYFNSNLIAYYFITTGYSKEYEEIIRQALEKIIQIKYRPLFDRIYSRKGHNEISNFDEVVKLLKNNAR